MRAGAEIRQIGDRNMRPVQDRTGISAFCLCALLLFLSLPIGGSRAADYEVILRIIGGDNPNEASLEFEFIPSAGGAGGATMVVTAINLSGIQEETSDIDLPGNEVTGKTLSGVYYNESRNQEIVVGRYMDRNVPEIVSISVPGLMGWNLNSGDYELKYKYIRTNISNVIKESEEFRFIEPTQIFFVVPEYFKEEKSLGWEYFGPGKDGRRTLKLMPPWKTGDTYTLSLQRIKSPVAYWLETKLVQAAGLFALFLFVMMFFLKGFEVISGWSVFYAKIIAGLLAALVAFILLDEYGWGLASFFEMLFDGLLLVCLFLAIVFAALVPVRTFDKLHELLKAMKSS